MKGWQLAAAASLALGAAAASQQQPHSGARPVFSHDLPQLDGKHLSAKLVEVSYAPGDSSPPHSHPCPVIGHVVEGAIRSQVRGQRDSVYTAGQSFYEAPNGVHQISANASRTQPAKLLAYFVCDRDVPLTTPAR